MELHWDENAAALMRELQQAGFQAVLVGGAVRDALLGKQPGDTDLAASADTQQLLALFKDSRPTGGEYGTVTVQRGGRSYEITPFRAEKGYADGRHPDAVRFGVSLEEDLARRDLTVNAMAWDGEHLIDPFGGQADLAARLIRAVGSPQQRFDEDGLRILRAFRFASTLSFSLENNTLAAACACADRLGCVSLPRIKAELQALLLGAEPWRVEPLAACGGLGFLGILPSAADENGFLLPLARIPCGMLLRWWAFFRLTGTDKKSCCTQLGFAEDFYQDLIVLDSYFAAPAGSRTALKRRAARELPVSMETLLEAFCVLEPAFCTDRALWADICEKQEPYKLQQLAIDGRALLALGLRGPEIGRRLKLLLAAVQAEPSLNRPSVLCAMAEALDDLPGRRHKNSHKV